MAFYRGDVYSVGAQKSQIWALNGGGVNWELFGMKDTVIHFKYGLNSFPCRNRYNI